VLTEADNFCRAGTVFQNVGLYEKAISQYRTALKADKLHASSHFNMATCLCNLADKSEGTNIAVAFRRKARSHYIKASENSENGFGEAHSNLAVLYLKENMLDEALTSCERALALHDINTMSYNKAFWNLSSVLRRLGCKEKAIERAWATIERASSNNNVDGKGSSNSSVFTRPPRIQCCQTEPTSATMTGSTPWVSVICVKWGTKYGAEYVKRLYRGVCRNISVPFKFFCFTDDTSGLELEANITCMGLEKGWTGWWNKASLFSSSFPLKGRILYIDLDTVITGSVDDIAKYNGEFAILSTHGIDNEGKDFSNGYNSSILMWDATSSKYTSICEVLKSNYSLIHRFVHRFDHWLEMMVNDADLVQLLYPDQIRDFTNACTVSVPHDARIVVFPLKPKPHEVESTGWVKEIWTRGEDINA
jgi:tetratricopeptide (TPR) repeat protein